MQEEISFGAWLRKQRRALDLSQQAFADQVGCAKVTLRRIEAGTLKPSKELANILLEKLGVPETARTQWISFARGLSEFPSQSPSPVNKPNSNLPATLTTFIGRENEKDEIIRLIAKHRLVTLVGTGGIGKTRLSLQVGEKLLEDYPDGVWFVAFEALSDPALVLPTFAALFDIREGSDRPVLEVLISVLHKKSTLLILDNCEHLLDACAHLVTILLTNCPNLKILATSREALGIKGEVTYSTPSLAIPEPESTKSIKQLAQYESVILFSERAALTISSFNFTSEKAKPIVSICRTLDGIPLAIELAAARVDILQVNEILEQLQLCVSLLISNNRIVQPKHQTMRASLDWSWGLLTEDEQVFLRQLSVFAGGWTLGSAQAVCDGNALNLMSKVAKKSLIMVDQEAEHETRYRFHEIVRQYAREKLIDSSEEEKIRTRHLRYFQRLSEEAEYALRGPKQANWFSLLFDERDNIRAALLWASETEDIEAGLYITSGLDGFWDNFDVREGVSWLDEFLQKPGSRAYPVARAKALCTQGWYLEWLQQSIQARSAVQESLDLCRACGDREGEIDGLLLLGFISDAPKSIELNLQALILAQSLGDTLRQADAFNNLGLADSRNIKTRVGYWENAIALYRKAGDLRYLAGLLGHLGFFLALNGDIEPAQKCLDESNLLVQQLHPRSFVSNVATDGYAQIALMRGDYEQARALFQAVEDVAQERGDLVSSLWTRVRLAYLDVREGNISRARDAFSEIAQSFQKNENTIGVVFALEGMAGLFVAIGKPEQATRLIGWADTTRKHIDDSRPFVEQADVDKIIAACLAKMGEVAFSDTYNEGQKMTLDEAVDLALKTAIE